MSRTQSAPAPQPSQPHRVSLPLVVTRPARRRVVSAPAAVAANAAARRVYALKLALADLVE